MNANKRLRFSPDIISYRVWLHNRFNLSHCDIEGLLAERGTTVSYGPRGWNKRLNVPVPPQMLSSVIDDACDNTNDIGLKNQKEGEPGD